jgi:hypothetical protein
MMTRSTTAKRLRPPAQGCRRGYPGKGEMGFATATRLRPRMNSSDPNDATALRLIPYSR